MTEREYQKPAACPQCGAETSFGGLGRFTRRVQREGIYKGTVRRKTVGQTWFKFHCPECERTSAILLDEQQSAVETEGGEVVME